MNKESIAGWTMYTDGSVCAASKRAAVGIVLYESLESEPVAEIGKSIPYVTSHAAEYTALIFGLKEAYRRGARTVEIRSDLRTMVGQLNGTCNVKATHLKPLYEEAKKQIERLTAVQVTYVERAQNARADKLASDALNKAETTPQPKPPAPPKVSNPPETAAPVASKIESQPVPPPLPTLPKQFWKPVGNELCVWNLEKLWTIAKNVPLETVTVAELHPYLDTLGWFGDEPLTLRRVAELAYQTTNADGEKPLLLCETDLLEGRFRLAKALCTGQQDILLKRLKRLPPPDARYPLRYAP